MMAHLNRYACPLLAVAAMLCPSLETTAADWDRCRNNPENYWLYSNDNGKNDNSSNVFIDNLYLENSQLAYPINVGETGIKELTDIAFLPNGQLFGVTFTHLVKIDLKTKTAEIIGDSLVADETQEERKLNALAADSDGHLYAARRDGELLSIDPQTGVGAAVGFYGNGLGSSGDLEFLPDGMLVGSAKQLGAESGTSDLLVEIDKNNGTARIIGATGFKEVFGLAAGPDNRLYGIADGNGEPKLVLINQQNGKSKQIGVLPDSEGLWGMAARFVCP